MNALNKILIFPLFVFYTQLVFTQTTMDYFSRPGLNINAYAIDIFGDTTSTSYSYSHKTVVCGDTALVMAHNLGGSPLFLVFEGKKVYSTNYSCVRNILFDFGLNVGNIMFGGPCDYCMVADKHDTLLLNGEMRLFMDLTRNSQHIYWIEGIGDIKTGFIPANEYESFRFVCARDSTGDLWINPAQADKCDKYGCRRPKSEFTFETNGLSVEFFNDAKFANQYAWDFGDGNTTTSYHATHTYSNPGCYTASLTVNNDCYPDAISITEALPVCIGFNWDTLSTIDFLQNFTLKTISDSLHFLTNTYPYDMFFRSTDGARTWQQINLPPIDVGELRGIGDVEMFDDKRGILVTYGSNSEDQSAVFITNDGGLTWSERGLGNVSIGYLALGNNGIAYTSGSSQYVHKTTDYGETWTDLTPYIRRLNEIWNFGDTALISTLHIIQPLPNGVDVIVKSYDEGYSWDTILLPGYLKYVNFLSPQIVLGYPSNETGVYKSYDGGISWILHLPYVRLLSLNMFDQNIGWMADYNGILYYTEDAFESLHTIKCGPKYLFGISPESSSRAIVTDGRHLLSYKGFIGFHCMDPDNDGDGYYGSADCDDSNFDINPAGMEIPDNGIDEDCDGIDLITALPEIDELRITIYPNPASEKVVIEGDMEMDFALRIYDLQGVLIRTRSGVNYLDISDLTNGIYYLDVITENEIHHFKKLVILKP